jgi:hypothetical protein
LQSDPVVDRRQAADLPTNLPPDAVSPDAVSVLRHFMITCCEPVFWGLRKSLDCARIAASMQKRGTVSEV